MMDTIILKCADCGGHVEVDKENNIANCPFCGTSKLLVESDEAVIERIRNKAFEDVANEKMQADKEIELTKQQIRDQEKTEKKLGRIRKSPVTAIIAILTIASLFAAIDVCRDKYYVSAIIMGCQTLLFFVVWLIRMHLIKGAGMRLHTWLTILAVLLIIPFFMFVGGVQHRSYDVYVWPDNNLSAMLPKPQSDHGEIEINAADKFRMMVGGVKENDYNNYVEECIEKGFSLKVSRTDYEYYLMYNAYNESGAELTIRFLPHLDEIEITMEGYGEFYEFIWSGRGLAALLPEPVSKLGIINSETEDSFRITVAETSITEFDKYVDACIEAGFTEHQFRIEDSFSAENVNEVSIIVNYNVSNVMEILAYTPEYPE